MSVFTLDMLTFANDVEDGPRARGVMKKTGNDREYGSMRLVIGALLMVALGVPSWLGAQTTGAADQAQRMRDALPADVSVQIESIIQSAGEEGIPSGPLYDKALEGAAKGIPGPRIVPAVSAYADRLRSARQALGMTQERWLVAGADALSRGVSPDALSRVARDGGGARGPMSVVVLGDLVESGVPADQALQVVSEAVRSGQAEADMVAISGTVELMIREGDAPPDAARRLVRHMRRGLPVRRMRDIRPDLVRDRPGPPVPPGADAVKKPRTSGGTGS